MRSNATRQRSRAVTSALLGCGAVAGPIFLGAASTEGGLRAEYHPMRHPVISLALGPRGGIQTANFAVTGMLMLAGALGLSRAAADTARPRSGSVFLAAAGIGLLGSAAFVTDPVSGYPPGTPELLTQRTTPALLHDLFGVPTFLGLPRRKRCVRLHSGAAAAAGGRCTRPDRRPRCWPHSGWPARRSPRRRRW